MVLHDQLRSRTVLGWSSEEVLVAEDVEKHLSRLRGNGRARRLRRGVAGDLGLVSTSKGASSDRFASRKAHDPTARSPQGGVGRDSRSRRPHSWTGRGADRGGRKGAEGWPRTFDHVLVQSLAGQSLFAVSGWIDTSKGALEGSRH